MDLEELGYKLRSVRNSRGLTLEEVAKNLDVSPSYLSEIERGKKIPSLRVLCNLSIYLDLPRNLLREVLEKPEEETQSLGEMLENRREEMGLTREKLSRAIGWPRTNLEAVESGSSDVPEEFLRDLAETLQFPSVFFEYSAPEAIGVKVKFFRQEKVLTQIELAERSGLSTSLVSKIERGEVQPSLPTLAKISSALEVSPCCFVFQLNQETPGSEESESRALEDSTSSKKSKLGEIISSLSQLDEEKLDELHEYLTELKD